MHVALVLMVKNFKTRMAVHEINDGDQIFGFCISEADEEICGIGFAKGLKKTHKSEGRLGLLDGSDLWLLMVVRDL